MGEEENRSRRDGLGWLLLFLFHSSAVGIDGHWAFTLTRAVGWLSIDVDFYELFVREMLARELARSGADVGTKWELCIDSTYRNECRTFLLRTPNCPALEFSRTPNY